MLEGTTILELGQVIAGTFGGTILADLGAEVIKIEPLRGDANRNPDIAPLGTESAIHLSMNRGKKSVAIDLKRPEGRELFYRLVETADAVIDNFRPGVMARLGIDHETLKRRNPRIVTASITGFGETGPAKDRPAFDLVIQAYSGHLHYTGEPDGPPSRVGIPLADMAGSIYAVITVLAALLSRELHNTGHHADVSMLDTLVSMLGYDALDYLNTGKDVVRQGTSHAHMIPWQAFEVLDGYVVVSAREEKFWRRLCDVIDRPDLKDDPRTRTNTARVANRDFVVPILEAAFALRTKAEWLEILGAKDIPAAPVKDFPEVFSDAQVVGRGIVRTYDHPTLGPIRYPASPMQIHGFTFPNLPAPMLGEHTHEVMGERLGLSPAEIAELIDSDVLGAWSGDMEGAAATREGRPMSHTEETR